MKRNNDAPKVADWRSTDAIGAFHCWLDACNRQDTFETKLGDVVLMNVSINLKLVSRFVEHAAVANPEAAKQYELQSTFELSKRVHDDKVPLNSAQNAVEHVQMQVAEAVSDVNREL
ncbi:hypothetical protein FRB93_008863 [Tulasnella sp. JGI-2019a]|nr:hypothetical protein FRB93_008863 [Tulasnella sp. JGI-2019a]